MGAIAGLVLLITGAWYCIRHRKTKPTYPKSLQEVPDNERSPLPELPAKERIVEFGAGVRDRQEIPGSTVVSELSSNHRYLGCA